MGFLNYHYHYRSVHRRSSQRTSGFVNAYVNVFSMSLNNRPKLVVVIPSKSNIDCITM